MNFLEKMFKRKKKKGLDAWDVKTEICEIQRSRLSNSSPNSGVAFGQSPSSGIGTPPPGERPPSGTEAKKDSPR